MSRQEIVGEKFTIAFGVDHVTGAFAQLWANPTDEQDGALIIISSDGVNTDYEAEFDFSPQLKIWLGTFVSRFKEFAKNNPGTRPNLGESDVISLAVVAGGFPDIAADVYRIFGNDI